MHTLETFYKPGLEPVEDIMLQLAPTPRALHPAGQRLAILWRILVCLLSIVACGYISYYCLIHYIETASFWTWFIFIAIIPICLIYIPWWLVTSYKSAIQSYYYCKNIYQNGIPTLGVINTLTLLSGQDLVSHHTERVWSSSRAKVRIDYTFCVGNSMKTGTALLCEQTINYLSMNSEICVLYLPDDPSENMMFPIPGPEFFEYRHKAF